ncbi:MAG: hypothetical protein WC216_11325 [Gallionella sp.]|jgi:hypothetical protein
MRILIVIPIIHTRQDMGSLLEQTRQAYIARYGSKKWAEHLNSIDQVWSGIRQMLAALELPYANIRLYQDGLPLCGKEEDIVREVATRGSQNHQLLLEFIAQGAKLMGTEDPDLLLREYRLHRNAADDEHCENPHQAESQALLTARDQFIAGRINSTLTTGEVGLLFLGMAHKIEPLLDTDILIRHLLPSLREKQEEVQCRA